MLPVLVEKESIESPSNLYLIMATVWILENVFNSTSEGVVLIKPYSDTKQAFHEHSDLITTILTRVRNPTTTFLTELNGNDHNVTKGNPIEQKKGKAIWILNNLESFRHLESNLVTKYFNYYRRGTFCIIYTGKAYNSLDVIRAIFHRLFEIYVINVNVLIASEDIVNVYTYFPFTKSKCQNVEPYLLGTFRHNNSFSLNRRNFFPKKIFNLWGCKVNVTTWTESPFMKIQYDKKTGKVISLEGIEGRLLELLATYMNFTIKIVTEPNKAVGNGKEPGAIKMLADGVTNISIVGLMHDKERIKVAQPSISYLNAPLYVGIPKGREMSSLERLIHPFTFTIWCFLGLSLLFGTLSIFILKSFASKVVQNFFFGPRNRRPFTSFWSVFYGIPLTGNLPRRNFARYILALWILYTLIIRSAYVTQLFIILQDSRTSGFNSVSEILRNNITFYTYPVVEPILTEISGRKVRTVILKANEIFLFDLFKILGEDENANFAVVLLRYAMEVYNGSPKNRNSRITILREPIFDAPLTLYMRKHSYLTDYINNFLSRATSTGIIRQFERMSLPQEFNSSRKAATFNAISLSLLLGLFFIYLTLLFLSTFVFFLELWSKNSPLTRKLFEIFNS